MNHLKSSKLIASMAAFIITFTNFGLLNNGLMEAVAEDTIAEEKAQQLYVEPAITKYVQFDKEENKGVLLETRITIGMNDNTDNYIPVSKNEIKMQVPKLQEQYPDVMVIANSTENTDGKIGNEIEFNKEKNWTFNQTTGLLTINYENKEKNNEYKENSKDEFQVIYQYPEASFSGYTEKGIILPMNIELTRTLKNAKQEIKITKKKQQDVSLKEQIADITTYKIEQTNEIYKGYMYISKENNKNRETQYQTEEKIEIADRNLVDKIEVKRNTVYKTETEELIANEVQYKQTQIEKIDFDKILGENGNLEILSNESKIANIKYEEDTEGNKKLIKENPSGVKEEITEDKILINYPEGIQNIEIKTSKPIIEGNLKIINIKAIKAQTEKTLAILKQLRKIEEQFEIKSTKEKVNNEQAEETTQIEIGNFKNNIQIELKEPETKVEWNINEKIWSTLEDNKLIINAKLRDNDSKYNLFDNPTLKIELPEQIIETISGDAKILNENGLAISNKTINKNRIEIQLSGKQQDYGTSTTGGVDIQITLNLKLKNLTPTQEIDLKLTCIENNQVKTNNTQKIKVQSKGSLLMLNNIAYGETNITTYNSNLREAQIAITENKNIIQTITLLNDYDEDISNVEIIEKMLDTEKENFFMLISSMQVPQNSTITYSENGENWLAKEQIQDFGKIKYYKIKLADAIKAKQTQTITITLGLPENANINQEGYLQTIVNYKQNTNLTEEANVKLQVANSITTPVEDKKEDEEIKGILDKINVDTKILVNGQEKGENQNLKQGQYFTYRITLTNHSREALEGLEVNSILENVRFYELRNDRAEGTRWYESEDGDNKRSKTINIANEESAVWEYEAVVKNDATNIKNTVELKLQEQTKQIEKIDNIQESKIKLKVESAFNEEKEVYNNDYYNFSIEVTNIATEELKNIQLSMELPEELDFDVNETDEDIKKNGSTITKVIENLAKGDSKRIWIEVKTNDFSIEETNRITKIMAKAKLENNEEYFSNILSKNIKQSKAGIEANLIADENKNTVQDGDELTYTINIENKGELDRESILLNEFLDRGLNIESIKLTRENGVVEEGEDDGLSTTFAFGLKAKEKATITIKLKVNEYDMLGDSTEIKNEIIIEAGSETPLDYSKTYAIRRIKQDVDPEDPEEPTDPEEPIDPTDPEDPNNPQDPEKEKEIAGIVWLDENKNGQRETNEKRISGIKVIIYNMETKEKKEVITNENGEYLTNVKNGKYIVIFEYDTNNYTLTEYMKTGIDVGSNSDAITSNVTIDGITKKMGVTKQIDVQNNTYNIDMGLIKNANFDLSLEKSISKVIVKNTKETKTINYENAKIAKVDLVAKYINSTNVIIEYTFTIKNNGDVAGYVGRIVDNLPRRLTFSSELDKDWYKGTDGELYNNELSNTMINPGETKKVTLTLSKQMNEDSTGTIKNTASIQNLRNLSGVEESNSNNNADSAEIVLSIKTGSPILYTSITLTCIAIIATGAYIINKKVLQEEK